MVNNFKLKITIELKVALYMSQIIYFHRWYSNTNLLSREKYVIDKFTAHIILLIYNTKCTIIIVIDFIIRL